MKESDIIINKYKEVVVDKIATLEEEYNKAKRNRKAFEELIVATKDKVYNNDILFMVLEHTQQDREYNWNSLYKKYTSGIQNVTLVRKEISTNDKEVIISYYVNFRKYALSEIEKYKELTKWLSFNIPASALSNLVKDYFITVANLMLTERQFAYNINSRLRITIKGKPIKKKKYDNNAKKRSINWGESFKFLQEIAEVYDPALLQRYKDKFISRKEFVSEMKKYTYHKETNPSGKKWLIYNSNDYNYWVLLNKSIYCSKQEMMYAIIPNNNRHVNMPLDKYIKDVLKTVNGVIKDTKLGFADKIRALAKVDNEYCINTFYNDI